MSPEDIADVVVEVVKTALGPLQARLAALEGVKAMPGRDGRDGAPGAAGAPGANGRDGRDGADGRDGMPGVDGLGWEDTTVEYDGNRTFTFAFMRDGQKRISCITIPFVLDRGVWHDGWAYEKGDGVTWGGSFWIAQDATASKPGDGATAWRLAVKAGRPGKDAHP